MTANPTGTSTPNAPETMPPVAPTPLRAATPPGWAAVALADMNAFLIDHACCERKAAASALGLLARHSGFAPLVEPMTALAREELEHFAQVFRLVNRRGLRLGPDDPDPYVNQLLTAIRPGGEGRHMERLLDRLIISAFIEARSAERFGLVAEAMAAAGDELTGFYRDLQKSEAGHFRVFVRVAERLFTQQEVDAAVDRIGAFEAKVMLATPWRSAVH